MCQQVFTADGRSLNSPRDLVVEGFTVLPEDLVFEGDEVDPAFDPMDTCLCGVLLEDILERSGVAYRDDPFGVQLLVPTDA